MNQIQNAQIVAWLFATVFSGILTFTSYKMLSKDRSNSHVGSAQSGEEHVTSKGVHHGEEQNEPRDKRIDRHDEKRDGEISHENKDHDKEEKSESSSTSHEGDEKWSYDESSKVGPKHWASIDKKNFACSSGKEQSPINITNAKLNPETDKLVFHYSQTAMKLKNSGNTVFAEVRSGQYIEVGHDKFALKELRLRNPSEHKIEGIPSAMEVQFVHENEHNKQVIVAVLVDEARENPTFNQILEKMPKKKGESTAVETVSISNLIPAKKNFYSYKGSLTEPPCYEGVKWIVMRDSISVSGAQMDGFAAIIKRSSRPIQELNGRVIESNGTSNTAAH